MHEQRVLRGDDQLHLPARPRELLAALDLDPRIDADVPQGLQDGGRA